MRETWKNQCYNKYYNVLEALDCGFTQVILYLVMKNKFQFLLTYTQMNMNPLLLHHFSSTYSKEPESNHWVSFA